MMICQCVEQSKDPWEKPCSWCICRGSLFAKWLAKVCAHPPTHPHMYTHTHTPTHVHTHTSAYTNMPSHTPMYIHSHTPIHPYTHMYTHTRTLEYTNQPTHMPHVHPHVHPYTLTYMHTPSHTPAHTYTCTACFSISHIHTHSILFHLSCVLILFQNSSSKFVSVFLYKIHILFITWTGQAAPSPRAQMVCPSICLVSSYIMSISAGCALPDAVQHKTQRVMAMAKNDLCTEKSLFVQRRTKKACFCMENSMSIRRRRRTKQTYVCPKFNLLSISIQVNAIMRYKSGHHH